MATRFQAGDRVRVKYEFPHGHIRTTVYVRGKTGTVVRYFGKFKNPEELAYGRDGLPMKDLYWVKFDVKDLWEHEGAGARGERIQLEIFEHWLEPA